MNHRDKTEKNLSKDNQKSLHSSQIPNKMEQSIPIKPMNIHRSCLKHRSNQPPDNHHDTDRLSTGRVSFAHPTINDGKTSQSQIEKNRRSDTFIKKAKALQLDELTYFKNHARDKETIDE